MVVMSILGVADKIIEAAAADDADNILLQNFIRQAG